MKKETLKYIVVAISICTFLLLNQNAFGQPAFQFDYDEQGNRIKRQLIDLRDLPPGGPTGPEVKISNGGSTKNEAFEDQIEKISTDLDENEISIFPNPVKDRLQIEIGALASDDEGYIALYNKNGALIKKMELKEESLLQMEKMAASAYILTIVINGQSRSWTIIKD